MGELNAERATVKTNSKAAIVVAGAVGNFVEWYDFVVYGVLATTISRVFFPESETHIALLSTFAIFAVGFVARPAGAFLFAHFGDRVGRRDTLLASVLLMGGSSILIGFVPSYDQVGTLAPVLLVIFRLLQGLSVGGEFAGAGAFLVEHAPRGRRGLYGSVQQMTLGIGLLVGSAIVTGLNAWLPEQSFLAWGWRVAFLFGGVVAFAGLLVRLRVDETPLFKEVKSAAKVESHPIAAAWRDHKREMITVVLITVGPTVLYYVYQTLFVSFATSVVGLEIGQALLANTIGLVAFVVVVPLVGALSDRIGRKPLLIGHAAGGLVVSLPLFLWMASAGSFTAALVTSLVGNAIAGLFGGAVIAMYIELFPTRVRYSGLSIPYGITIAAFGGTAPFVATALTGVMPVALGATVELLLAAAISLVAMTRLPETFRSELKL